MSAEPPKKTRNQLVRDLILIAVLGLICLQVFRWQTLAFEATWMSLKGSVMGLALQDHLRWGAICNSVGNYRCSEKHFRQAYQKAPKNIPALGNLAVALSRENKDQEANASFEKYFQLGGLAYDVMFFYAQHLLKEEKVQDAISWMYRSLSVHTSNQSVANQLLDHLAIEGRYYESLSLAGSLMRMDLGLKDFWTLKFEGLLQQLEARGSSEKDQIRIPSLDANTYLVPARFDNRSQWTLFAVDQGEPMTYVNEETLSKWSLREFEDLIERRRGSKEQVTFEIPQMQVGPWLIENVKAVLCESCPLKLGQSAFDRIEVQKGQDQLMDYIFIQKSEL
ncbi:MAG: hypothetical protein KDD22_00225 [Bdellovibrionales bacterium]|nr:hypothetical protein [Bdellovibrionales bacterium]